MDTIRTNVITKKPALPLYLVAITIALTIAAHSTTVKASECVFHSHIRADFCS